MEVDYWWEHVKVKNNNKLVESEKVFVRVLNLNSTVARMIDDFCSDIAPVILIYFFDQ